MALILIDLDNRHNVLFRHTIMSLYKLFVVTMLYLCHLVVVNLYSVPLNISNL
jgi:hypothetical protein